MIAQPAYARVHDAIQSEIINGLVGENAQLPTERSMCDKYGVSRITIRHALMILEEEGLIRKRQGQGIFVCPRMYVQPLDVMSTFADQLRSQNVKPSWKVLSMESCRPDASLIAALKGMEDLMYHFIRRLSLADDGLYSYDMIYVPEYYLRDATASQIERDGLYDTIKRIAGVQPDHMQETYESVLAPSDVCYAMQRKPPLAVTKLVRISFCGSQPVEFSTRYVLGDKMQFKTMRES